MFLLFFINLAFAECPKIYCEEVLNGESVLSGRCSVFQESGMIETETDENCKVQWGAYDKTETSYKLNQSLLNEKKQTEQNDLPTRLTKKELDELKARLKAIEDGAVKK